MYSPVSGSIQGDQEGQLAIITRCNFTLFAEAVKLCCFTEEPIKIAFVGGPDAPGFNRILDIYLLMLPPEEREKTGRVITDGFVKMFEKQGLAAFEKYVNETQDIEVLGKIKIVKTYTHQLPEHIAKIRSKTSKTQDMAGGLFVHKSLHIISFY